MILDDLHRFAVTIEDLVPLLVNFICVDGFIEDISTGVLVDEDPRVELLWLFTMHWIYLSVGEFLVITSKVLVVVVIVVLL